MALGTQTYGSETYNGQNIGSGAIDSISQTVVSREGGTILTLNGTFVTTKVYNVQVGGIQAYSGVAGQGTDLVSTDGATLDFVMPALTYGSVSDSIVVSLRENTVEIGTINIAIVEKPFRSMVFDIRNLFPRWYGVGARRLELEPQEQD